MYVSSLLYVAIKVRTRSVSEFHPLKELNSFSVPTVTMTKARLPNSWS